MKNSNSIIFGIIFFVAMLIGFNTSCKKKIEYMPAESMSVKFLVSSFKNAGLSNNQKSYYRYDAPVGVKSIGIEHHFNNSIQQTKTFNLVDDYDTGDTITMTNIPYGNNNFVAWASQWADLNNDNVYNLNEIPTNFRSGELVYENQNLLYPFEGNTDILEPIPGQTYKHFIGHMWDTEYEQLIYNINMIPSQATNDVFNEKIVMKMTPINSLFDFAFVNNSTNLIIVADVVTKTSNGTILNEYQHVVESGQGFDRQILNTNDIKRLMKADITLRVYYLDQTPDNLLDTFEIENLVIQANKRYYFSESGSDNEKPIEVTDSSYTISVGFDFVWDTMLDDEPLHIGLSN